MGYLINLRLTLIILVISTATSAIYFFRMSSKTWDFRQKFASKMGETYQLGVLPRRHHGEETDDGAQGDPPSDVILLGEAKKNNNTSHKDFTSLYNKLNVDRLETRLPVLLQQIPPPLAKRQITTSKLQRKTKYHQMTTNKPPIMYMINETEVIQRQRQQNLKRVCREQHPDLIPPNLDSGMPLNHSLTSVLTQTYVNDDFNITVTIVRKAGSSNWRRFMRELHNISSRGFQAKGPPLTDLSKRPQADIKRCLKDYTKILFVRHPLVRLLSGFRDKFVNIPTGHYVEVANRIIWKIRRKDPADRRHPDLTFTEFLTFLIGSTRRRGLDIHWVPIFQRHRPCLMRYDVIGKLETIIQDTSYLIDNLGVRGQIEYSWPKPYTGSSNPTLLVDYYSKVPPEILKKICQIYRDDFVAFDYPLPVDLFKLKTYFQAINQG